MSRNGQLSTSVTLAQKSYETKILSKPTLKRNDLSKVTRHFFFFYLMLVVKHHGSYCMFLYGDQGHVSTLSLLLKSVETKATLS